MIPIPSTTPMVEALTVAALVAGYQNGLQLLPVARRFPRLTPAIGVGLAAVAAVVLAFRSWDPVSAGLGLAAVRWAPVWGAAAIAVAATLAWLAGRTPALESTVADPRVARLGRTEFAAYVGLRIPFVSALAEEILFRGIVYGLVAAVAPAWVAIGVSSVAFGLWHVMAGLEQAGAQGMARGRRNGHVVGTVMFTALAGVGFGLIRFWTGGVWAPAAVHAAVNVTFALAARRRGRIPA
jgi:uncharacterized protein